MMLTPEQLAELRLKFEAWELSRLHEPSSYDKIMYLAREGDGYSRYGVHCDWLAWQAASYAPDMATCTLLIGDEQYLFDRHVDQPEPVNKQGMRKKFEEWAPAKGYDIRPSRIGLPFADGFTNSAWEIWQAAISAAEAAQPVVQHAGKFFTWDDETGFDLFDTKEEAKKAAQESIDLYRDIADCDGWPEAVENVCWGVVLGKTLEVELPVEGNTHAQLLSRNHYVDYVLTDAQQPSSVQPVAVPYEVAMKVASISSGMRTKANNNPNGVKASTLESFADELDTVFDAMLSASQKPEGVAEPTEAMIDAIQQVRLIDWCCDKDGNPTTVSECSARAIAEAVIATGQKGGAA